MTPGQQEFFYPTDVAKVREVTMAKLKADIAALPDDADWNGSMSTHSLLRQKNHLRTKQRRNWAQNMPTT